MGRRIRPVPDARRQGGLRGHRTLGLRRQRAARRDAVRRIRARRFGRADSADQCIAPCRRGLR
ncbi:hypothetical protein DIE22_37230 [Burkholderia sp. Bp9142]|nr:hypothetical protein DIE22_37230 [Burkholderia sp. Bp9142]RQR43041.1 hypothetical protein DIE21_36080 [Burkholderia sp. Bp9140]